MSAIDIVIPVYNAAADLARCVDSVLAHTAGEYSLVLIDDGSPETSVAAYFEALARRRLPHIEMLRNESNLGFTLTANRGLSRSTADVVLLNSDTVVTAGWLDALVRCARSDPSIGTVTPFSNNAEICSYPRFCENNAWPEDADPAPVRNALAGAAVPSYPDLPTGVGFCLYVRRALIDAIGVFDPAFGHGYGEENDFCLRAAKAGFRNVLCDDAFVVHLGERSFAGRKSELGVGNMQRLLERHPEYLDLVRGYIAADPLRAIRGAAQLRERIDSSGLRGVMHVIHGHGGGTEHHARALIEASRERFRHYLVTAVGDAWQLEEPLPEGGMREFRFERAAGETWRDFTGGLCATFGVDLIHLHNVSGSREGILGALLALGIPYGYTAHDLNVACPTITFLNAEGKYCGAETDAAVCARCLAAQPAFAQTDIVAWRARHRAALAGAAFLIAPSRWVATTMARYFADRPVDVIPLAAPSIDAPAVAEAAGAKLPAPSGHRPLSVPDDGIPTVAVLGAVGPDKGARRLERMVELARAGRLRLRFVLIGYLDRLQTPWQSDDALFTVHARYAARELPELLAHYRVRLVAFPSACPETFSFTLSEAWNAGRPVVVPPIGALAERVADTGAGWVLSEGDWRDDARMLARIAELVAPERASELAAAADRARAMPQPSMATMVERSLAHYAAAVGDGTVNPWRGLAPFAPSRVLAALGYRPWHPPTVAGSASGAATPSSAHDDSAGSLATPAPRDTALSQLAWRWGGSRLGRVLRRMMPAPLRDALKSRLF